MAVSEGQGYSEKLLFLPEILTMGASSVAAEVIALYDKLQHAADKAVTEAGTAKFAQEDRAVDMMKQLRSCEITTKVLLDTQVCVL